MPGSLLALAGGFTLCTPSIPSFCPYIFSSSLFFSLSPLISPIFLLALRPAFLLHQFGSGSPPFMPRSSVALALNPSSFLVPPSSPLLLALVIPMGFIAGVARNRLFLNLAGFTAMLTTSAIVQSEIIPEAFGGISFSSRHPSLLYPLSSFPFSSLSSAFLFSAPSISLLAFSTLSTSSLVTAVHCSLHHSWIAELGRSLLHWH